MNIFRPLFWLLGLLLSAPSVLAAVYYVNYSAGSEKTASGSKDAPFPAVSQAIALAKAGDTIYILPSDQPIHDSIAIRNLRGEPEQPIVIDGMMNVFTGARSLSPEQWREISPGLFRRDKKTAASMLRRYFMWIDGKHVRMGRRSKFISAQALKEPDNLQACEWTTRAEGEYYLRLPEGKTLQDITVREPVLSSGVAVSGTSCHIVIRNMILRDFWNDGLNIHHAAKNIVFENTAALFCGDDGASAHGECETTIRNFVSIGNSTGICHVDNAVTRHENVYIAGIDSRDVYLLSTENHLRDVYVDGSAPGPFTIQASRGKKSTGTVTNCIFLNRVPDLKAIFEPALECQGVRMFGYLISEQPAGISICDTAPEQELEAARRGLFAIFAGRLERELAER